MGYGSVAIDHTARIVALQLEALRRLHWLAHDYMDRASARGIPPNPPYAGQEALLALADAVDDLAAATDAGADDGTMETAYNSVLDAIDAAKEAADHDAMLAGNLCQAGTPEGSQAIEVCDSPMLGHLRSFMVMELHLRDAAADAVSAAEAHALAAEEFAWGYIGQSAEGVEP